MSTRKVCPPLLLAAMALAGSVSDARAAAESAARYLVQAPNAEDARRDVRNVGARVDQDLGIIHAVSAHLTPRQAARLRAMPGVHVFNDRSVETTALPDPKLKARVPDVI